MYSKKEVEPCKPCDAKTSSSPVEGEENVIFNDQSLSSQSTMGQEIDPEQASGGIDTANDGDDFVFVENEKELMLNQVKSLTKSKSAGIAEFVSGLIKALVRWWDFMKKEQKIPSSPVQGEENGIFNDQSLSSQSTMGQEIVPEQASGDIVTANGDDFFLVGNEKELILSQVKSLTKSKSAGIAELLPAS